MLPEHLTKWSTPTPVLDHGSITLLDVMGDHADVAVLQAARTSTGSGMAEHKVKELDESGGGYCTVCNGYVAIATTQCRAANRNLIRYLLRNHHATPFEAAQFKVHVVLPIFVERQWARHCAAGFNEVSARYTQLPKEWYIPTRERVQAQSTDNRQGSGGALHVDVVDAFRKGLNNNCRESYGRYEAALAAGVTRELARLELHVNHYTEKVWWVNLRMLLHLLALRKHEHAQWEIRQYADAMWLMVKDWAPWTAEAFEDYTLGAHTFSRQEMALLREMMNSHRIASIGDTDRLVKMYQKQRADVHDLGTIRERKAFWKTLGLLD